MQYSYTLIRRLHQYIVGVHINFINIKVSQILRVNVGGVCSCEGTELVDTVPKPRGSELYQR
jgi:hypothetical protein